MMRYHFKNEQTGEIHPRVIAVATANDREVIERNTPGGFAAVAGDPPKLPLTEAQLKARARISALAAIRELEQSSLRAVRELALGAAGALERLQALDAAIVELRKNL
jgi:hypothetical protein